MSQRPFIGALINMAKVVSLHFIVSGKHGPWTATLFLAKAQTMTVASCFSRTIEPDMTLIVCWNHEHQHDLKSATSVWLLVTIQPVDIYMTSGCSPDCRHLHDLWC